MTLPLWEGLDSGQLGGPEFTFKIGDFSKLSRVSVRMLRHYDQIGLFEPTFIDPQSSYRFYAADQLPRLNRILALKDLGFPLEQIVSLLSENVTAAEMRGMLKLRRAELEAQLEEGRTRLAQIEARIEQVEREGYRLPNSYLARDSSEFVTELQLPIAKSEGGGRWPTIW